MIHGPRYEPDLGPRYTLDRGQRYEPNYGPRYAPARGPRYAPGCGLRYVPDRGPRNCRTNLSATAPLDLRTSGPTAQIQHTSMDIEAPRLWSPQPES